MHNFTDLIHKEHHILLEYFSGISKISDVAESEDTHDLVPREDRVDATT